MLSICILLQLYTVIPTLLGLDFWVLGHLLSLPLKGWWLDGFCWWQCCQMMPLQQSTFWCDMLYWEGWVYPIQGCSLKMIFSSCIRYLSCCRMEVLICILFWMIVDCHWEPVIERSELYCCGFWALCKHSQERACLSSGSWQRGLLLEVMGQLAAWPEVLGQGQQRGQLSSWRGLPNCNCGRALRHIIHIRMDS